jgi:hypothetical protein
LTDVNVDGSGATRALRTGGLDSASRTYGAADAAVVNVAAGHEAALDSGHHDVDAAMPTASLARKGRLCLT